MPVRPFHSVLGRTEGQRTPLLVYVFLGCLSVRVCFCLHAHQTDFGVVEDSNNGVCFMLCLVFGSLPLSLDALCFSTACSSRRQASPRSRHDPPERGEKKMLKFTKEHLPFHVCRIFLYGRNKEGTWFRSTPSPRNFRILQKHPSARSRTSDSRPHQHVDGLLGDFNVQRDCRMESTQSSIFQDSVLL